MWVCAKLVSLWAGIALSSCPCLGVIERAIMPQMAKSVKDRIRWNQHQRGLCGKSVRKLHYIGYHFDWIINHIGDFCKHNNNRHQTIPESKPVIWFEWHGFAIFDMMKEIKIVTAPTISPQHKFSCTRWVGRMQKQKLMKIRMTCFVRPTTVTLTARVSHVIIVLGTSLLQA